MSLQDITLLLYPVISSQIDGVTIGFSLDPTLAKVFLVYHKKNWLEHCPLEHIPFYY